MKKSKFTPEQIQDWRDYEAVRVSGKYNMFSPQARATTGLSTERYLFVLGNYGPLKEAAAATTKANP